MQSDEEVCVYSLHGAWCASNVVFQRLLCLGDSVARSTAKTTAELQRLGKTRARIHDAGESCFDFQANEIFGGIEELDFWSSMFAEVAQRIYRREVGNQDDQSWQVAAIGSACDLSRFLARAASEDRKLLEPVVSSSNVTDEQSWRDIEWLLHQFDGISEAHIYPSKGDSLVIRFRCNSIETLKILVELARDSNLGIEIGCPCVQFCDEKAASNDLPFYINVTDDHADGSPPSKSQIFGIFLARALKAMDRIDGNFADDLQRGWHAIPY